MGNIEFRSYLAGTLAVEFNFTRYYCIIYRCYYLQTVVSVNVFTAAIKGKHTLCQNQFPFAIFVFLLKFINPKR